jgi:hypothetical protein
MTLPCGQLKETRSSSKPIPHTQERPPREPTEVKKAKYLFQRQSGHKKRSNQHFNARETHKIYQKEPLQIYVAHVLRRGEVYLQLKKKV